MYLSLVSSNKSRDASKKLEAYVGWTGMASASSLAHFNAGAATDRGMETVEMDPQYAEGLGFALDDVVSAQVPTMNAPLNLRLCVQVEIGLFHDLGYAQSVSTEPVTSDDWEILVSNTILGPKVLRRIYVQELHASHVESTLLSQVRVAVVGQEIDVWVLGRTRVRLNVGKYISQFPSPPRAERRMDSIPSAIH